MKSLIRRSLVGIGLLIMVVTLSAFFNDIPEADKHTPLVAVHPPPSHIKWTHYPVGGLFLARYQEGDITHTQVELLPIPAGSILSIPQEVPGKDPDHTRTKT